MGGVEKGDGQLNKRRGGNGLERGKDMYEGPYVIVVCNSCNDVFLQKCVECWKC